MSVNDHLNQSFWDTYQSLIEHPKIKKFQEEFQSLKTQAIDPEIWDKPKKAGKINQKLKAYEKDIDLVTQLKSIVENYNLAKELEDQQAMEQYAKQAIESLAEVENMLLFDGKYDDRGIVMNIHSGAGGVDAQDWARMLADMYQNFFRHMDWQSTIIDISLTEEGGIKFISLDVQGYNVYGYMQTEIGVHRLVRISPFNSGGTRETSFAQVEILPQGLDEDSKIQEIQEDELKWDYFMASGKGGQSVNTTYSAVRLTHIPTGIVVSCQNERDQRQNKNQALKYLKNKLAALEIQKQQEHTQEVRGELKANEFGSQIRNYVLHPYKLVKDTRTGWETSDTDSIINHGLLLPLILDVKKFMTKNL